MKREIINTKANEYYRENIEGEPLDQNVPIDCFIKGAEFILEENKKNFNFALKNLEDLQKKLIKTNSLDEWIKIVNSLRLCACIEPIQFKFQINENL